MLRKKLKWLTLIGTKNRKFDMGFLCGTKIISLFYPSNILNSSTVEKLRFLTDLIKNFEISTRRKSRYTSNFRISKLKLSTYKHIYKLLTNLKDASRRIIKCTTKKKFKNRIKTPKNNLKTTNGKNTLKFDKRQPSWIKLSTSSINQARVTEGSRKQRERIMENKGIGRIENFLEISHIAHTCQKPNAPKREHE